MKKQDVKTKQEAGKNPEAKKKPDAKRIIHMVALAVLSIILIIALAGMREFGSPENTDMDDHFIANGQQETGANNIVTSIVFDYRGFDTLGEASVLFAAVLGVGVLLDWGKGKVNSAKGQSAKTKNTKSAKQRSSKTVLKSFAKPARKKKSNPEAGKTKTKSKPRLKK